MLRKRILAQAMRFLRHRRGNIAIMSALLMPVLLLVAAFAVDTGSLYVERREAQSLTDIAAIAAAANIENAEEIALSTLTDNRQHGVVLVNTGVFTGVLPVGEADKQILVERGRYVPDRSVAPADRFTVGGKPENAVKVRFRKKGRLYFAGGIAERPEMTTSAIAASTTQAAFSVGSRLASVNAGMLNTMLGALLGTSLSLQAADYRALLGADVTAVAFLDALAHELQLTAGTYNDLLDAEVAVGRFLRVLALVLGDDRDAQLAVQRIASATPGTGGLSLPLSHLLDLGALGQLSIGQENPALGADIGVMDLIGAAAAVANRDNQVHIGLDTMPGGILGITLDLAIGEPPQGLPWFAIGEAGKIVRTAQTRLLLKAEIDSRGLLSGLLGTSIELPILVEVAYAEARLKSISCSGRQPTRIAIDARPGIVEAWIGEIDAGELRRFDRRPLVRPARLLQVPTLRVTGGSHFFSGNMQAAELVYDRRAIEDRAVKTVTTKNMSQSLVQSLVSGIDLDVKLLGLIPIGIPLSSVKSTVGHALNGVSGSLDQALYGLLETLGIRVGEADVRVSGATCGHSVLVH